MLNHYTDEQLQLKANQAWEMAGLARQDGDTADEQRRTKEAQKYDAELKRRHEEQR